MNIRIPSLALILLAGCSSSADPTPDAGPTTRAEVVSAICDRFIACGKSPMADCLHKFEAWFPPPTCLPSMLDAPCADIDASPMPPALHDACMPPCTQSYCSDDGAFMVQCDPAPNTGGSAAFECTLLCQAQGRPAGYCALVSAEPTCKCF